MAFEQRDMGGALFKNDKKGNEKAPDYKGNAMVDGFEYQIAAWVKDGKSGKYMSLGFQRKDEPVEAKPVKQVGTMQEDDDAPF